MKSSPTLESLGIERFNLIMELSENGDAQKDAETSQETIKLSCEQVTMERALRHCIANQERATVESAELDEAYPSEGGKFK